MRETAVRQPDLELPSQELLQRLQTLGLLLVRLEPDGTAQPLTPCSWAQQALLSSRLFINAAAQWQNANPAAGPPSPHQLWPGLWLVALTGPSVPRPLPSTRPSRTVLVLMTRQLLDSEQLQALAGQTRHDYQLLVQALSPHLLDNPQEVHRLAQLVGWMQRDLQETHRASSEILTLTQQLGETYEELSILYKLSTNLTLDRSPAQILTETAQELQQVLGLRWIALLLSQDQPSLGELAGRVFMAGPVGCDPHLLHRIADILLAHQLPGGGAAVIDNTQLLHVPYVSRIARQLLLVPLQRENQQLGVLLGGDKQNGQSLSSVDAKLCNALASSLAIFLENMMLYEDMSAMFLGTLHSLTTAIDAKDRYTFGHSERVAALSKQLALHIGLDARQAERVYLAGLVHDVGKIGVPESVLCKTTTLTPQEFALIQMHPQIGARILQDIRQMRDLIPGVLHHHERWDGKGYPFGLAGTQIPLMGRLICLADSFDAMSSSRTYRSGLAFDAVLAEIRRCSGTQFDPDLARAFLEMDLEPFARLVRQHQEQLEQSPDIPLVAGGFLR